MPGGSQSGAPYVSRMLSLPDGNVLFTNGGSVLYEYNPNTSPLPAGVPVINSLVANSNGTLTLTGTGLNGINAGSAYGDDADG